MRKSLRVVALVVPMLLIASNTYASIKAGSACSKAGSKSVAGGKSYTCIKSGKKLVWDKGVVVAKPKTSESAAPATAPTSTATATKLDIATPTSVEDLYEKRKGIAYGVWSRFNEAVARKEPALPVIEIHRGPNTPTFIQDPKVYFRQVVQLFPGVALPKKVVVFYWNQKDLNAVTSMALSIMGAENIKKNVDETTGPFVSCNNDMNCDVGHALIGIDGTAYIGIGLLDSQAESERSGGGNGGVEKVEFYHALQLYNYHVNNLQINSQGRNIQSFNLPPFWLNIGGENLVSNGLSAAQSYDRFRQASGFKYWSEQVVPGFNQEWINEYLDIKNVNTRWKDSSYTTFRPHVLMGSYLSEIFVAIKGPSVLLEIHERMSRKESFTDAFQGIFGVSWDKARPELAKVIYDRYLYNY